MVNTFLPYADFVEVAQSLDDRRLGKQRVEAFQILKANYVAWSRRLVMQVCHHYL